MLLIVGATPAISFLGAPESLTGFTIASTLAVSGNGRRTMHTRATRISSILA
jgi:hypothetical protein